MKQSNHFHIHRVAVFTAALCAALLGGCASSPAMPPTPVVTDGSGADLTIKGAHGVLTPAQSKAVISRLKANNPDSADSDILQKHLAVEDAVTGSPLTVGNRMTLLIDGPATYGAMQAAMEGATDNINMESYIFEDDEQGKKFADILIAKQKSGVQVNLVYDSVGSIGTPREFFQPLKDAGVNVLEYNPINPAHLRKGWEINQRDHRKLLVVDGRTAFVGGVNISSVYSSGSFSPRKRIDKNGKKATPWRDTHVQMEGPVVADFQKLFLATWEKQKGPALAKRNYFPPLSAKGNDIARAIGSAPDQPYAINYTTFMSAINSAESQIFLTNAYFVPDPQLVTALKDAAARGVDVRMLLPSTSDSQMVFFATRSFYEDLLQGGVKIYERQDALLHAKTALIDGVWSTIGSSNLDWRSFAYNQEIDAVILGSQFGDQMQAIFQKDMAVSNQITLEKWQHRPISERMKEFGARLWGRLL